MGLSRPRPFRGRAVPAASWGFSATGSSGACFHAPPPTCPALSTPGHKALRPIVATRSISFRPRAFPAPRRLPPETGLRACCSPLPAGVHCDPVGARPAGKPADPPRRSRNAYTRESGTHLRPDLCILGDFCPVVLTWPSAVGRVESRRNPIRFGPEPAVSPLAFVTPGGAPSARVQPARLDRHETMPSPPASGAPGGAPSAGGAATHSFHSNTRRSRRNSAHCRVRHTSRPVVPQSAARTGASHDTRGVQAPRFHCRSGRSRGISTRGRTGPDTRGVLIDNPDKSSNTAEPPGDRSPGHTVPVAPRGLAPRTQAPMQAPDPGRPGDAQIPEDLHVTDIANRPEPGSFPPHARALDGSREFWSSSHLPRRAGARRAADAQG